MAYDATWSINKYQDKGKLHSQLQKPEITGASFLYWLHWKSKQFNQNVNEWKAIQPINFMSFQRKIVQMGALQKLQDSIQTLIILWPVYPIHNSLFWVTFEELPFCHFTPPKLIFVVKTLKFSWSFIWISKFFKQTENNNILSQSSHVSAIAYGISILTLNKKPCLS